MEKSYNLDNIFVFKGEKSRCSYLHNLLRDKKLLKLDLKYIILVKFVTTNIYNVHTVYLLNPFVGYVYFY